MFYTVPYCTCRLLYSVYNFIVIQWEASGTLEKSASFFASVGERRAGERQTTSIISVSPPIMVQCSTTEYNPLLVMAER